jgi:hypothetical protein
MHIEIFVVLQNVFIRMTMDNRMSYVRSIPIIYNTMSQMDRGLRWLAARFGWRNLYSLQRFPEFAKVFPREGKFAWDVMCWSSYRRRMDCPVCDLTAVTSPGDCDKYHVCAGINCDTWLLEKLRCGGVNCPQRDRKGGVVLLDNDESEADLHRC